MQGLPLIAAVALIACVLLVWRRDAFTAAPVAGHMLIVEPRRHADLQRVLRNFDALGPEGYDFVIFHGRGHRAHALQAAAGLRRQVTLHELPTDNLDAGQYSALLKDAAFWNRLTAENVLVFQTDTALCSKSPHTLQAFHHLPYVGAAYDAAGIGRNSHWGEHAFYGVGGLSFRKRSVMLQCIADGADAGAEQPEDVFFSNCVDSRPDRPPDARTMSAFCTQNSFSAPSWGAHKTSLLHPRHRQAFGRYCPEADFMT